MHKDVGKRLMALLLSICMIAGMIDLSGFTVRAEGDRYHISHAEIKSGVTYTYTGEPIRPEKDDIVVYVQKYVDGSIKGQPAVALTPDMGVDFQITSYGQNKDTTSQGSVNIGPVGDNIDGNPDPVYFTIEKADINTAVADEIAPRYPTTNMKVEPTPIIRFKGKPLANNTDYTYEYENNEITDDNPVLNNANVVVTGKGNFKGEMRIPFTAEKLDPSNLTIELKSGDMSDDYTLLRPQGGYAIPQADFTGEPIELDKKKDVVVKYTESNGSSYTLKPEEFELEYTADHTTVGVVTVKAKGISGKYKDIRTETGAEFFITKWLKYDEPLIQVVIKPQPYPGKHGTLDINSILDDEENGVTFVDPGVRQEIADKPTSEKIEVTVIDSSWKDVEPVDGKIKARARISTVSGSGYKSDPNATIVEFDVVAPTLSSLDKTGKITFPNSIVYDDSTDWLAEIEKKDNGLIQVGDGQEYVQDTDYSIKRKSASQTGKAAGTYTIVISPVDGGKLTGGSIEKQLVVEARSMNDSQVSIVVNDNLTYNGKEQHPEPLVTFNSTTLTWRTDYELNWKNATNATTAGNKAVVEVTGKGNFKDTFTYEFTIQPLEISESKASTEAGYVNVKKPMDNGEHFYTGSPIEPYVDIIVNLGVGNGTKPLGENDYSVSYVNEKNGTQHINVSDGKITMTISGVGNYTGDITRKFTIKKQVITKDSISIKPIPNQYYTGVTIQPNVGDVTHTVNGVLQLGTDYELGYGDNIECGTGAGTVIIKGKENYEGEVEFKFNIVQCDIGEVDNLSALADARVMGMAPYDLINGDLENNYYRYDGTPKELPNLRLFLADVGPENIDVSMEPGTDYTVSYSKNTTIGTAEATITGIGNNYSGKRTLYFRIKGSLGDLNDDPATRRTNVEIPDQIYTAGVINPKNAKVTFKLATGEVLELKEGVDFTIENERPDIDPTTVGDNKYATITGIGDYYEGGSALFNVIPLNLTTEEKNLEDVHKYLISGINTPYVYSGRPIAPKPEITHNGRNLTTPNDYSLQYYSYDAEKKETEITDPENYPYGVGSYSVKINGSRDNYEGFTSRDYEIEPFDLTGAEGGRIEVRGVEDEVILDQIKYDASPDNALPAEMGGTEAAEEKHEHAPGAKCSKDEIIWKDLQVWFKPVGIQEDANADYDPVQLEYGKDYTVEYANNKKPGEATYTIKGKGNFSGTIEKTFRILVDLGGSHTTVQPDDCVFKPEAAGGNEPNVTVTYLLEMIEEADETITLDPAADYDVAYDKNKKATHPLNDGWKDESALDGTEFGEAVVSAKEGGCASGDNSKNPGKFKIFQRDISNVGTELETELAVSGLQEGYEYNGSAIIPDLKIMFQQAQAELTGLKLTEGEAPSGEYDYTISAKYNTNVWTDEPETADPEDESNRKLPEYEVFAKRNADLKYDGNYCGKFSGNFTITPRQLSEETIDKITPIVNAIGKLEGCTKEDELGWKWAYNRSPINFPADGNQCTPEDPEKNALEINWNKGDGDTLLVEGKDYTIRYENNTKIGKASIWIEAPKKSNYAGAYEKNFAIVASITEVDRDPSVNGVERYMELPWGNPETVSYGIVPTYPDMRFEDKSPILAGGTEPYILQEGEDKDFVIITEANHNKYGVDEFSQNNVNISGEGVATVVVKGVGYYTGVVKREYKIVPKPMTDKGIVVRFVGSQTLGDYKNAYLYTGEAQEPTIEVYNNNAKDIEGMETEPEEGTTPYDPYQSNLKLEPEDYEVVRWENNVGPASEKGAAKVVLKGKGKYTGENSFEFNIVLRQMDTLDYKITETAAYNGLPQQPKVEVSYQDGKNKVVLAEGADYDINYTNNVNVPLEGAEEAELPTITITGKGGYEGENVLHFDILPRDINTEEVTVSGAALYNNGEPVTPSFNVKDMGVSLGAALELDKDYRLENQSEHAGVAEVGTVELVGQGNYTGKRTETFRIIPPNGVLQIEQVPEQDYNGRPIRPEVKVNLLAEGIETPVPLTENDYDVTYTDNQNAGTATITVTGKKPFSGTATMSFVIKPKNIGTEGAIDAGMALEPLKDHQYTGSAIIPVVELTFQPPVASQATDGEEAPNAPIALVVGRDYRISAVNNTAVGTATATITGIGNYSGTITSDFRILGSMNMVTVAPIPVQEYTGSPVTPAPVVSLGGKVLAEGTDYTVEYQNNVERGTATIVLTGVEPWYTGKKNVTFEIARELSAKTIVRGVAAAYTYTGQAITPPVRIEDDGNILTEGVDYQLTYAQNVNAGTATINILGINKYTGSTSTTFQINPQQLGRAQVSPVSEQVYNGKEHVPPITVSNGDKVLENGKDYTLVYVENVMPGRASIVIRGTGNYTGAQTVSFNIKVPGMAGVKFSKYTNKSVTISWTKNTAVSGYEIYNEKNRRAARVKKGSSNKGTVSKLKAGTAATFRVRAYVIKNGQYFYGPFTSVKTATAPNSTKIKSLTSKKSKQAVLKWNKVKGASQYEVYRSTSKKGKYKKIATTKKTTYTDKKLKGKKKYYYKVRVSKKINKKNYYSSYSAVKSVTVKK